jgi:hypothetical protein
LLTIVSQKKSLVQAGLKPIKEGVELAIVSCTLSLPIKSLEVHVVVVNIQVEGLEELVTPKFVPLNIL